MLAIAATLTLADVTTSVTVISPLAEAEQGYQQCYEPIDDAKTCQSLAAYNKNPDGTWDNTAVVLIAPGQPITLETVTPVTIKGGAICGFIRREDVLNGKLRFSAQVVPNEKAAPILAKLADGMASVMNKEICTTYFGKRDDLLAIVKIDGAVASVPEQHVRWVRPSDGYTVAPVPVHKE